MIRFLLRRLLNYVVLLVLASDIYREEDYIRDVDEFLTLQEKICKKKMKGEICDPVP